jgi:hypothetical protein
MTVEQAETQLRVVVPIEEEEEYRQCYHLFTYEERVNGTSC